MRIRGQDAEGYGIGRRQDALLELGYLVCGIRSCNAQARSCRVEVSASSFRN